eukprot:CAMPEP_0177560810 /NCGR_PEP_ID=MMETSP0369-20130122/71586_1 /TAXON_ID=447022 ORGANISM="Scrippsiella hangoei-like, Strain SHHI-4" /NCGR_SAMPLE_ID=MMETSP0369 /ASSEMBLY_ACC=CAM_ASM_000364 /LENGTH=141 /DNA_ID=CAMNT_0019047667 /DNA_START=90 /DNA_END=515 /DNA_ORIENTATION=+
MLLGVTLLVARHALSGRILRRHVWMAKPFQDMPHPILRFWQLSKSGSPVVAAAIIQHGPKRRHAEEMIKTIPTQLDLRVWCLPASDTSQIPACSGQVCIMGSALLRIKESPIHLRVPNVQQHLGHESCPDGVVFRRASCCL